MTVTRFFAVSAVFISFAANAAPVSVPFTFTNGQVADALQVNQNFTALVNGINAVSSELVVGTGQLADGAVTTPKIANGAVTTVKIADDAVGNSKLAPNLTFTGTTQTTGNFIAQGEITTVAINLTSDRNAKEAFIPVNAREVLEKVTSLPISEWQYKTQSDVRHIGPMAQDFRAAFALGIDEKHITSVDADGVALAAIQGLNEKIEERDAEVALLRSDNELLSARLRAIEKLLGVSIGDEVVSN